MTCKGFYSNDGLELEVDGKVYFVSVEAECDYYHEPAVMYYRDGTGDPGCDEIEITSVTAEWYDVNDNIVQPTEEMSGALDDYLNEMDFSEWELDD